MNNPILINHYIPDHKDPEMKKVVKLTDVRTHHATMKELHKEPDLELFYTFLLRCPHCGREGYAQIISIIAQQAPDNKVPCFHCRQVMNTRESQALYFAARSNDAPAE